MTLSTDRGALQLADDLCERQAVEIGHRYIGKECPNVGVHLQDCECLLAIASFEDAVARFAQHVIRQKPDKGFVFDNENYNRSGVTRVGHYTYL